MVTVTLNTTWLRTSVLGFGCVSLTMHDDVNKAVAVLERAFDSGITHFDVARLYGFGQAEGILGKFLKGKRDRVTVATKFGLQPNETFAKHKRFISFARKVVHRFPPLRKLIPNRPGTLAQAGAYSPEQAAASLEKSLTELGTDHIEIFLLHEASLADAQRGDLIEFLEAQVKRGTIRYHGVASTVTHLPDTLAAFPQSQRVFQFNHNVVHPNLRKLGGVSERGVITFGVLGATKELIAAASADPQRANRFGERVGIDLTDRKALNRLLLQHAVASNPNGITLFASTKPDHIAENALAAGSPAASGEQLAALEQYAAEVTTAAAGSAPH